MLFQETKNEIYKYWLKAFRKLERLNTNQIRQHFEPHEMVGMHAVASICCDPGNHKSVIDDNVYNCLCESIDNHFDECIETGTNYFDRRPLKCHSGHDMKIHMQSYHKIAGVLLGHPCRCSKCSGAFTNDRESAA